jgi:hypothetical protein
MPGALAPGGFARRAACRDPAPEPPNRRAAAHRCRLLVRSLRPANRRLIHSRTG